MVNITMLVHNRPRLTAQSIDSLYENTPPEMFNLTIYDDASDEETKIILEGGPFDQMRHTKVSSGTGEARNQVIRFAKESPLTHFEKGEYLYLSDNDVYFKPKWLETLLECYEYARAAHGVIALGAYNHPYNPPRREFPFFSSNLNKSLRIGIVDALALQSWLWKWEDWDKFGPFDQTPPGRVRFSEDFAVSQKIREFGEVAVVLPHLIINTGRTDSFGEKIPGAELIPNVEGVIVE